MFRFADAPTPIVPVAKVPDNVDAGLRVQETRAAKGSSPMRVHHRFAISGCEMILQLGLKSVANEKVQLFSMQSSSGRLRGVPST